MQYDVFISYSRRDYVDENGNVIKDNIVSKIKDVLKENGINYWFDEDGINSGDEFAQLITTSIKNSKIVLFVSSVNSNQSEWTRKEIATAISYKKKIIPFKYDETPFNDSIYLYLADLDFISYANNGEKALKRLVSSILQYVRSFETVGIEKKKKIHDFESELKDLNDSRKLILIEIEKSSVMLKSLKDKYNETVDKINKIEKELCKLDNGRSEYFVEKLDNEPKQEEKHEKPRRKSNAFLIILLLVALVYAVAVTFMKFGAAEKPSHVVSTEPVPAAEQKAEPIKIEEEITKPSAKKMLKDVTIRVGGVDFEMIAVNGGTFIMGATPEQAEYASKNEKPAHKVTVDGFCIGKYEVTQKLWKAVMGTSVKQQRDLLDSSFKLRGEADDMPIYYVSLDECKSFVKKLNALTGKKFRLPTEAEWEYAARGGLKAKGMLYGDSNNVSDVAWCEENSKGMTHAVGGKKPNVLGLYDMIGNVGEWCQDKYGKYSNAACTNPKGATSGYDYVVRGGDWASTPDNSRVSSRSAFDASMRSDAVGFRLVLD